MDEPRVVGVEYGTTFHTDTCASCFAEKGSAEQATHELIDNAGIRVPVCSEHAAAQMEELWLTKG